MRGILASLCWRELVARAYYQVESLALYGSYKFHNHRYEFAARLCWREFVARAYYQVEPLALYRSYKLHNH